MASIHTILKRMREASPPEVDYDEETESYWFGQSAVSNAYELVNPELMADACEDIVNLLIKDNDRNRVEIREAASASIAKKVETITKKRRRD